MTVEYVLVPTKEEKDACAERIQLARTALVLKFPFFGILAINLAPIENNTWCQTVSVDGKHFYYNVHYILGVKDPAAREWKAKRILEKLPESTEAQIQQALDGLTDHELMAAMCHEILHCAYNHFLRRGSRDPEIWNKAADYSINQILVRDNIGKLKSSWLYDRRFEDMSAEEIYNILMDERSDDDGKGNGGSSFDQHGSPSDEGSGQSRGKTSDYIDEDGNPQPGGNDPNQMGPDISSEDMEKNMDDFQNTVMNASNAGKTPAEITRMVNKLRSPKIDWRSKLQRTLRSCIKNDLTFMNPSRRSWANMGITGTAFGSPIIAGFKPDEEIDICVAIDTSGSISEKMLRDFLSEVNGITKQFVQFKIKLLCFDTSVHNPQDYDPSNVKRLLEYDISGGGGTDFEAVWEYMKAEEYKPKQLVMFTDGQPWDSWGDPNYCNTLFIIHSYDVEAPFGVTVPYSYDMESEN